MGVRLEYNLENIGNIDNASIIIKPLTIISGVNSSGKTFVTKSLYTILDAIYQNHFLNKLLSKFRRLEQSITQWQDLYL
jgi:predicted ATPase